MLTYHNNPQIKQDAINAAIAHREADQLVRGQYWKGTEQRGCAIGCHAHHLQPAGLNENVDQHQIVSDGYGLPLWLCKLEDHLFENLPEHRHQQWPEQLLHAIPVGVDLTPVYHRLQIFILDQARSHAYEETAVIIDRIKTLHQRAALADHPSAPDWAAARAAVWAAASAAASAAAGAAARAAASAAAGAAAGAAASAAAGAAAGAAARAAASAAAGAAARAAASAAAGAAASAAASAAARAAVTEKIADHLLLLLEEAAPQAKEQADAARYPLLNLAA